MANIGGNGENLSDDIQQNNILEVFSNGYFDKTQNIVVAGDELPIVGLQETPGYDIEFGANPNPEMNPVMANIGGNGENKSGDIQQNNILEVFNNGYFEKIQNIVVAGDESYGGITRSSWFGANPPLEMNPVGCNLKDGGAVLRRQRGGGRLAWEDYFVQNNEILDPLYCIILHPHKIHRNKIIKQAVEAMEELLKLAIMGEPLWQHNGNGGMETLNGFQYLREFGSFDATMEQIMRMVEVGEPQCFLSYDCNYNFDQDVPSSFSKLNFEPLNIETSRETAIVKINPMNIVQLLMDTKQWATTFYSIVSRTTLLGVILENMSAEFHQCTPLIPARQSYFARYCKKHTNGTWGVVDVSLESLFPYQQVQFRRERSGCVIQEVGNRGSEVTWIEHVEVDSRSLHPIFRPIVSSGFAFSAKGWIATINRHCQWFTTSIPRTAPIADGECMVGITQNFAAQDVRLRYKNILKVPGKPSGNIVIFTTSTQIPVPMEVLFDFLRHERTRNRWDLLSNQRHFRELVYVNNGENPKNRVSIMQVNSPPNKIEILYLKESYTDETGSYIVYAPMDIMAMSKILNGGNPKFVSILPSGFSIMPDKAPGQGDGAVGSILTLAFQSVDRLSNKEYMPPSTLKIIDAILSTTVASIKDAMLFGIR
ncbi:hypothetical protein CXB51_000628 [Gossypium anomalum]|uniref:START domain-containing protein n=1 Tax=Gossypium anomalum TaxID=47600 RepID=A0A8J5ZK15_9ROSI|nr:hypothetical protein CXB51_000628 [Gossypium anomalum]